jgi:hypothetical protein
LIENHAITGSAVITLMDQMRAFFWGIPRLGRICGLGAIIGLCLLQVANVFFLSGTDIGVSDPWVVGIGLLGFLLWPLLIANAHRRLSSAQKQLSYEISSEQIQVRDAAGSAYVFRWDLVRAITETSSGFSIAVKPAGSRWLPRRAFSAEAIESLRGLAKARLGQNACLKDQLGVGKIRHNRDVTPV